MPLHPAHSYLQIHDVLVEAYIVRQNLVPTLSLSFDFDMNIRLGEDTSLAIITALTHLRLADFSEFIIFSALQDFQFTLLMKIFYQ